MSTRSDEGAHCNTRVVPVVLAIVLTHNDPVELQTCLDALGAQTTLPANVLVVDNASEPPATPSSSEDLLIQRLPENVGPAGGHSAGLAWFRAHPEFEYAWVMDDDVVPDAECLEHLVHAANTRDETLLWPAQSHPESTPGQYPGWFGVLIPRAIVEAVGTPRAELFWWTEDTEYLQWRIPRAGFDSVVVRAAKVTHTGRRSEGLPDWKLYYETRNSIVYRVRTQRLRHPIKLLRTLASTGGRIVLEPNRRNERARLFVRAVVDGFRNRLGLRHPVP